MIKFIFICSVSLFASVWFSWRAAADANNESTLFIEANITEVQVVYCPQVHSPCYASEPMPWSTWAEFQNILKDSRKDLILLPFRTSHRQVEIVTSLAIVFSMGTSVIGMEAFPIVESAGRGALALAGCALLLTNARSYGPKRIRRRVIDALLRVETDKFQTAAFNMPKSLGDEIEMILRRLVRMRVQDSKM